MLGKAKPEETNGICQTNTKLACVKTKRNYRKRRFQLNKYL